MTRYLKPDAKSLIWLGVGFYLLPKAIGAVQARMGN